MERFQGSRGRSWRKATSPMEATPVTRLADSAADVVVSVLLKVVPAETQKEDRARLPKARDPVRALVLRRDPRVPIPMTIGG